ncbi:hypothetical protein NUU61_004094 [Penicillium alfredii]|uniref:Solute carrier family 40 member n=1 Tax=Penicillium alfredii TaxID=1506179 RepID=A0A9W9FKZ5_9EURO|nr:uncharacterized protein NUU61_004094 [Penicillium alfredii]KAJ5101872.1 hypothetical protein NUU61_004094 [Penicillium alfredii]
MQQQADRVSHEPNASEALLPTSAEAVTPANWATTEAQPVLTRLYISHTLSTWNSRMFEFGAVLFLASIFPGTLLYASIYALVRALSAVVLSSWLGARVDQSDRLVALRHSIVWQRVPVAASCLCFLALLMPMDSWVMTTGLFVLVGLLACMEKLAAAANTVAVERDWAIVISDSINAPRQDLNASMRRIDLFCKLVAPVFISLIESLSTRVAIWTVFGVNTASVLIEYVAIAQVYRSVPALTRTPAFSNEDEESHSSDDHTSRSVASYLQNTIAPWQEYIANPVFLASFALSLLYLTVLSFAATMTTYLLHTGFTPIQVSCMRIGSVAAELSGTWTAPVIMNRIGPIRSGLWFLNWQFCCVAAASAAFAFWDSNSRLVAGSLITGVALSRIGLWGFDLSVQFLVQDNIEEHARARFSATEMALQNIFEMLSFASTIVFPRPEQFQYPVLISSGAVAVAAVCFAAYVRKERGHLLHRSRCLGGDKVLYQEIRPEA